MCWLVNFPQYGEKDDIATISIKEKDLKKIPGMDARVNEEIKEQFDRLEQKTAPISDEDNALICHKRRVSKVGVCANEKITSVKTEVIF